jgi:hypothetical protein
MKPDQIFFKDLSASRTRVTQRVAELCAIGLHAEMPPHEDRPHSDVRMEYADSGDMWVCGRVEHKIRELHFTNRADFPYPTVIIDEQYKIDDKSDLPLAYVIENKQGTCAAVIYGWQRDLWRLERKWDRRAGRYGTFYTIDKRYVRFCKPQDAVVCARQPATKTGAQHDTPL